MASLNDGVCVAIKPVIFYSVVCYLTKAYYKSVVFFIAWTDINMKVRELLKQS